MDVKKCAEIIWNYHHMNQEIQKSDIIFVLGSHDTRVAERGAQLFLEGWAPYILFSGYLGAYTLGAWDRPEAEIFAEIALNMGVPKEKIIIENKSTNTGENVIFSRQLLEKIGISVKKIIAVQKPYMERRTYATIKKIWEDIDLRVTSPLLSFQNYPTKEITLDKIIHIMVGDLQRIMIYPERGFQISQDVPKEVEDAYDTLVKMGYTSHLVKKDK